MNQLKLKYIITYKSFLNLLKQNVLKIKSNSPYGNFPTTQQKCAVPRLSPLSPYQKLYKSVIPLRISTTPSVYAFGWWSCYNFHRPKGLFISAAQTISHEICGWWTGGRCGRIKWSRVCPVCGIRNRWIGPFAGVMWPLYRPGEEYILNLILYVRVNLFCVKIIIFW